MKELYSEFDSATKEKARWLFSGECRFIAGAATITQLPEQPLPEVAFCGTSNVGKSTLINALTGRQTLARTSSKPGHTAQLNLFRLRDHLCLVDLPGYGYAKRSKKTLSSWSDLISQYLKGRPNLKRVLVLIDARRHLKENDHAIMKLLDEHAVSYQIVLTKTDKCKKEDVNALISDITSQAFRHTAMHRDVIITSSREKKGLDDVQCYLLELCRT